MTSSHTVVKAKRKSIRQFMDDSTAAHTTLSRSGFGSEVRYLLQQAYRIGLHNGKLIRKKPNTWETATHCDHGVSLATLCTKCVEALPDDPVTGGGK